MSIFDSHAHYLDSRFDEDRDELLTALFRNGVCGIVEGGTDVNASAEAVALAQRYPQFYATVGIHPQEAAETTLEDIAKLRELAANRKTVGIGEIGLDYYWEERCPRLVQQQWFRAQLELANELSMPVVIHDREAHEDTLHILKEYHPEGILHCFSGSVEMAREILNLGMYISLGGVVTFKNARKTVEVASYVPLDRLVLETDAPYLAPEPHRGKRCDSSMIRFVAETIAALRGITADELLQITAENARRAYRLL